LDREMERRVKDLVESEVEKLEPGDPFFYPVGARGPSEIHVFRPKLEGKGHLPPLDGLLAKAKAAFEFRKATPRADERLMQSGELDEDDLYRLMQGDMRVFRDITEEVLPSAAVYLLVDMSGSMSSYFGAREWSYKPSANEETRKTVAFKMAYLMVKALHNRPNVKTRVLGHTGEVWDKSGVRNGAQFYRLWEEGDRLERLDLINQLQPGENYDSYAIAWAGKLLQEEEADQKVLIVLSDGQPAGTYYGGDPAMRHVRIVTDGLKRKGVDTIQLSMARDLSDADQRKMFEHYIPAPKSDKPYAEFLRQFTRLLEKVGRKVN
jgi:nitric oxide reductase activation protein